MSAPDIVAAILEQGCTTELTLDPYRSDPCAAEIDCLSCGSCPEHCDCETPFNISDLDEPTPTL